MINTPGDQARLNRRANPSNPTITPTPETSPTRKHSKKIPRTLSPHQPPIGLMKIADIVTAYPVTPPTSKHSKEIPRILSPHQPPIGLMKITDITTAYMSGTTPLSKDMISTMTNEDLKQYLNILHQRESMVDNGFHEILDITDIITAYTCKTTPLDSDTNTMTRADLKQHIDILRPEIANNAHIKDALGLPLFIGIHNRNDCGMKIVHMTREYIHTNTAVHAQTKPSVATKTTAVSNSPIKNQSYQPTVITTTTEDTDQPPQTEQQQNQSIQQPDKLHIK